MRLALKIGQQKVFYYLIKLLARIQELLIYLQQLLQIMDFGFHMQIILHGYTMLALEPGRVIPFSLDNLQVGVEQ